MTPVTHYLSSNGQPRRIADMPTPHLANAIAKLRRAGQPGRAAELEAMRAEHAKRPDKEASL
jgi:hypothetical protein